MRVAEPLLVAGLLCAALAAGLCQFVMIGLIGVGLFVVAFGLLLVAGSVAHAVGLVPLWQRVAGLALYSMGVLLLLAVAAWASSLAYDHAMSSRFGGPNPIEWQWTVLGLTSFLPALAITLGLRNRARWSWGRCCGWGAAALCVMPTAVVVFWVLAPVLPLTA